MRNITSLLITGTIISLLFILTSEKATSNGKFFNVAISYENQIFNNQPQDVLGFNLEFYITEKISLNYTYNFSLEPHAQWRHTPILSFWGWELMYPIMKELAENEDEELEDGSWAVAAFIMSMAIPEGVNFHFPWRDNDNTGIVLSLNPLGFEYLDGKESLSSGISMQARFGLGERLFVAPLAGFNYVFNNKEMVFRIGISAGIRF